VIGKNESEQEQIRKWVENRSQWEYGEHWLKSREKIVGRGWGKIV
jgi:hypothetical protein